MLSQNVEEESVDFVMQGFWGDEQFRQKTQISTVPLKIKLSIISEIIARFYLLFRTVDFEEGNFTIAIDLVSWRVTELAVALKKKR